jgi:predicted nuclease of predicted toxin-antitoxin system
MKRVLLDENLDRRLKNYFSAETEITSVTDLGWQSKKNGELPSAMREEGIDILLTSDRNLRFRQNLTSFGVQIVVIISFDNRLKALVNSITAIENGLRSLTQTDQYVEIDLR